MDGRERSKAEVAALWGVPGFMAGSTSADVKYSNMSQQHSAFYRDAISPVIKNIQGTFTAFFKTPVRADIDALQFGDRASAIQSGAIGVKGRIITPNQALTAAGYPPSTDPRANQIQWDMGGGNAQEGPDPERPRAGENEGEAD